VFVGVASEVLADGAVAVGISKTVAEVCVVGIALGSLDEAWLPGSSAAQDRASKGKQVRERLLSDVDGVCMCQE
jgi:hypothetical protein